MQHPDDPTSLGSGRYELLDPLGSGGVSTVFQAKDRRTDADCAIKVLLSHAATKPRARTRFLQEAHTTSHLQHPNIVRVHEIGDEGPPFFYVMELAAGSLAHHVRTVGACDPPSALGFVFQVLRALDHAHLAGVVHRDVKPHNMLLMADTGALKLTDFGIAKWVDGPGPPLTRPGDALGTLAYMAPEQRTDPRNAGPRSDLYGVGATLYNLLTRRRPFDVVMADTDASVLLRLPEPIRPLVRRSTAPHAEERFDSAFEMAEAVAEAWASLDPAVDAAELMSTFRVTPTPLPPESSEARD